MKKLIYNNNFFKISKQKLLIVTLICCLSVGIITGFAIYGSLGSVFGLIFGYVFGKLLII